MDRLGDRRLPWGNAAHRASVGLTALMLACVAGCASDDKLTAPTTIQSPWPEERTWAVVPFLNESGVSAVDTLTISDHFVAELDGVDGIACIPLNRSLAAMRALGLRAVTNDQDARAVMRTLQVDGLMVGSITAYEPYRPLQLGVATQIYTSDTPAESVSNADALLLPAHESGSGAQAVATSGPSAEYSRVYDAQNHDVLMRLQSYASGRFAPKSGFREGIYLASIDAFSSFVAFDTIQELMKEESARVAPAQASAASAQ